MLSAHSHAAPRRIWNKDHLVGPKLALKPQQVWSVRFHLKREGRTRDLALFDLARADPRRPAATVLSALRSAPAHDPAYLPVLQARAAALRRGAVVDVPAAWLGRPATWCLPEALLRRMPGDCGAEDQAGGGDHAGRARCSAAALSGRAHVETGGVAVSVVNVRCWWKADIPPGPPPMSGDGGKCLWFSWPCGSAAHWPGRSRHTKVAPMSRAL